MKLKKRLLCILLCILTLVMVYPSSTFASTNYLDWKQYDSRWKDIEIGNKTMGRVGCTTTSLAILLKHSGIMDDKFTPKVFVEGYKEAGGYSNNSFVWGTIDKYTNGVFKYKGDTGWGTSINKIKKYYNKGYYITIGVDYGTSTHWVACIKGNSTDKSKIKIADPGHNNVDTLEELYKKYSSVNSLRLVYFECTKSKANERDSNGSESDEEDNIEAIEPTTDDSNTVDLGNGKLGLVDPMTGKIYQLSEASIPLVELEDIGKDQLKGVADWKNNIESSKADSIIKIIRVLVSFLGILFLVWTILIYLSYWYDRINNFVDIELLPIVTGGRLKVSPEEDECTFSIKSLAKGEMKTVNHRAIISICVVALAFAVLIITGRIYNLIGYLIVKMQTFLKSF